MKEKILDFKILHSKKLRTLSWESKWEGKLVFLNIRSRPYNMNSTRYLNSGKLEKLIYALKSKVNSENDLKKVKIKQWNCSGVR